MEKIKRFGVSLEEKILKKLDNFRREYQFPNRSRAIRYLIKEHIVEDQWKTNEQVAGVIVLVYDHHKRNIADDAIDLQHKYHKLILSVQHLHLDRDICLETIVVKGKAKNLKNIADKLIGLKGVVHGKLVMTTVK